MSSLPDRLIGGLKAEANAILGMTVIGKYVGPLQLLSRMNRGRGSTPSFLAALSDAIGEPVEIDALVSLPDTDSLTAAFREGYQRAATQSGNSYRRFFVPSEEGRVYKLADCLAEKLPDEGAFFLTKLSEECGAVRLNLSTLLRHAESIIRLDGDSVSALSKGSPAGPFD